MLRDKQSFIFHNLSQGLYIGKMAEYYGRTVLLYSSSGAASALGPAVFLVITLEMKKQFKIIRALPILDCGREAGTALSAIRVGIPNICFQLDGDKKMKIEEIASKSQTSIFEPPSNPIDLGF